MVLDWIVADHDCFDVMIHEDANRVMTQQPTKGPLLYCNKRATFAMVQWTLVKVLVVAIMMLSSQGKQAMAYYYQYPINIRGRAQTQRHGTPRTYKSHCISYSAWTRFTKLHKSTEGNSENSSDESDGLSELERDLLRRVSRLEALVSKQEVELRRLKKLNEELSQSTQAFAQVIQLLKEAGLGSTAGDKVSSSSENNENKEGTPTTNSPSTESEQIGRVIESFDDSMIFGTAPSSVNDAADAAGAAILAAMLGGKQRMLVDVRDAELSSDPETLVQFIELAILPIAAGLEGLKSTRNRVKIVFPKVSQLLEYRRTMALAAPEVVALSTLGFDPVERRDKVVVIVAPEPDDEEALVAMRELLYPSDSSQAIQQPVVILNYHMVPVSGLQAEFETAYHLRLLSVHYMSGEVANELLSQLQSDTIGNVTEDENDEFDDIATNEDEDIDSVPGDNSEESRDEAVEAAMKHAQQLGVNQGVTRAMVIRAYPRPWHVFVDTSPDTDTDFEVAATFDEEPTLEELNMAIVECLEGSEREDELVAQQMQQALEEGQLDRVSDWIGEVLDHLDEEDEDKERSDEDFDMFEEDSV